MHSHVPVGPFQRVCLSFLDLAQLAEQWTVVPRVAGSIPAVETILFRLKLYKIDFLDFITV